jgi:hypothetical protein
MLDQKNVQSDSKKNKDSVITKEKKEIEVVAPKEIVKRDGRKVEFDIERMINLKKKLKSLPKN